MLYANGAAYCVVAVESVGRQVPIAFLERIKEDFTKKYAGGKAATATANSLNKEFGYTFIPFLTIKYKLTSYYMLYEVFSVIQLFMMM